MVCGEIFFCIGMSEFDLGLDLVVIKMCVVKIDGGWLINGIKLWFIGV